MTGLSNTGKMFVFNKKKLNTTTSPFNRKKKKLLGLLGVCALVLATLYFTPLLSPTVMKTGQQIIQEIYINGKTFETHGDTLIPFGYTILDFGASSGGSSTFLDEAYKGTVGSPFGAGKTLGLDIDPVKVAKCVGSGHECIRGDAMRISRNGAKVKGSTMWHVLEHLPTCEMSRSIWEKSSVISILFSSFRGPAFDQAEILRKAGFHRYYENWRGHTCNWDALMLVDAISNSSKTVGHLVVFMQPIVDSDHEAVLPSGSKPDSQTYDAEIHPTKPTPPVKFHEVVYREVRAVAVYDLRLEVEGAVEFLTALAIRDVTKQFLLKEAKVYSCKFPGVKIDDKIECFKKFEEAQRKAIKLKIEGKSQA